MIAARHAALACLLLSGCNNLTLAEPKIDVSPYVPVYRLRGNTQMQSLVGGVPTDNPNIDLAAMGSRGYDTSYGVRGDIGDGFAGLRIDYYRLNGGTASRGTTPGGWGNLPAGTLAGSSSSMDELRFGYAYDLYDEKFGATKGRELQLRCAPMVVLAHRDLRLRGFADGGTPNDSHEANDAGVVYGGARLRATYRNFSVDAEYAISPGVNFGGEFHGTQQDFELRGTWNMSVQQDIGLFAGWRYSEFAVRGQDHGLQFRDELVLDGFQFGIRIGF